MSNDFYRAFEERHRGSRLLIKQRLEVYLPFLMPLMNIYPLGKAIDLGCGRGEWLELLADNDFDAEGVDLDEGMLAACRERHLSVQTADALAVIRQLPDASRTVVSGFHLVEHLRFEDLQSLLKEAMRVLAPGGILILETPNPENLAVGACHFYLDPTHQRPIPPDLLLFATEYNGFARSKVLRLQEAESLSHNDSPSLMSVLSGVSPDYAVVAQKFAPAEFMAQFDLAFEKNHGLNLDTLAMRFEDRLTKLQVETQTLDTLAMRFEDRLTKLQVETQTTRSLAEALETELKQVLLSRSWKITKPLRWANDQWRRIRSEGLRARAKALLKKGLRKLKNLLSQHPRLRASVISTSRHLRLLKALRAIQDRFSIYNTSLLDHNKDEDQNDLEASLPPRAREIFLELQNVSRTCKKGQN